MRIVFGKTKLEKELEDRVKMLEESCETLQQINKSNTEKELENILKLNEELNKIKAIVKAYDSIKKKRRSPKDFTLVKLVKGYDVIKEEGKGNLDKLYKSIIV